MHYRFAHFWKCLKVESFFSSSSFASFTEICVALTNLEMIHQPSGCRKKSKALTISDDVPNMFFSSAGNLTFKTVLFAFGNSIKNCDAFDDSFCFFLKHIHITFAACFKAHISLSFCSNRDFNPSMLAGSTWKKDDKVKIRNIITNNHQGSH